MSFVAFLNNWWNFPYLVMLGLVAAEPQAMSITTRLAEANREAGLKEAEVAREKIVAAHGKSRDILLQEAVLRLVENAPAIVRELVKPAEKISELKILQLGGQQSNGVPTNGASSMLGSTIGPFAKTIMETSALMPLLQSVMNVDQLKSAMGKLTAPEPEIAGGSTKPPPRP